MRTNLNIWAIAAICGILALPHNSPAQARQWQTAAKLHRTLKKAEAGTLLLDADGVEFRSARFIQRWPYTEIHTFDLSQRELTLRTYQNRPWHEPGERPFRFTLSDAVPPK